MRFTAEVSRGDWIRPRLGGWSTAGGAVATGFEAYLRILHPISATRLRTDEDVFPPVIEERGLRWSDIAAATGTVIHSSVQWRAIGGDDAEQFELPGGWQVQAPREGFFDPIPLAETASVIARVEGDGPVTAAVWNGWGELSPDSSARYVAFGTIDRWERKRMEAEIASARRAALDPMILDAVEHGPLLELPNREYVLLEARLAEFAEPTWMLASGLGWSADWEGVTPNLIWPDDHAWMIGGDVDYDSTIVGGSATLIAALEADPALETVRVEPDTELHYDADPENEARRRG